MRIKKTKRNGPASTSDTFESEPSSVAPEKADSRQPRKNRAKVKILGVAAIAAAVAIPTAFITKDNREDKLQRFGNEETTVIEQWRTKGADCLGSIVVLSSGVQVRKTPHSINGRFANVLAGNEETKLETSQEIAIRKPIRYVDDQKSTWLGFSVGAPSSNTDKFVSSEVIASKIMWVNYSQLLDRDWADGEEHVREFKLSNNPTQKDVPCDITDGGQIQHAGVAAAYGVRGASGSFETYSTLQS